MVQAWREAPSPARRAAIEAYAATHPKDDTGLLARLALGVGSYEQKDYSAAIAALRKVQGKIPRLADYTAYYPRGIARGIEGNGRNCEGPGTGARRRGPVARDGEGVGGASARSHGRQPGGEHTRASRALHRNCLSPTATLRWPTVIRPPNSYR